MLSPFVIRLQNIDFVSVSVSLCFKEQDPWLPFSPLTLTPTRPQLHACVASGGHLTATANVITVVLFLLHIETTSIKRLLVLDEFSQLLTLGGTGTRQGCWGLECLLV